MDTIYIVLGLSVTVALMVAVIVLALGNHQKQKAIDHYLKDYENSIKASRNFENEVYLMIIESLLRNEKVTNDISVNRDNFSKEINDTAHNIFAQTFKHLLP